MANLKISEMETLLQTTGEELIPVVSEGKNKKIQLKNAGSILTEPIVVAGYTTDKSGKTKNTPFGSSWVGKALDPGDGKGKFTTGIRDGFVFEKGWDLSRVLKEFFQTENWPLITPTSHDATIQGVTYNPQVSVNSLIESISLGFGWRDTLIKFNDVNVNNLFTHSKTKPYAKNMTFGHFDSARDPKLNPGDKDYNKFSKTGEWLPDTLVYSDGEWGVLDSNTQKFVSDLQDYAPKNGYKYNLLTTISGFIDKNSEGNYTWDTKARSQNSNTLNDVKVVFGENEYLTVNQGKNSITYTATGPLYKITAPELRPKYYTSNIKSFDENKFTEFKPSKLINSPNPISNYTTYTIYGIDKIYTNCLYMYTLKNLIVDNTKLPTNKNSLEVLNYSDNALTADKSLLMPYSTPWPDSWGISEADEADISKNYCLPLFNYYLDKQNRSIRSIYIYFKQGAQNATGTRDLYWYLPKQFTAELYQFNPGNGNFEIKNIQKDPTIKSIDNHDYYKWKYNNKGAIGFCIKINF